MAAASVPDKDYGSPLSSSASFETPQWPLRDNLASPSYDPDNGNNGLGRQPDEDARGLSTGPDERQQPASPPPAAAGARRPWWKTRKALIAYAVAAVLLVVFVVLLVLGLEGYLHKVGPFSHLFGTSSSLDKASFSPPPNPLSTIPLVADPYGTPSASISVLVDPTPTSPPVTMTSAVRTQFLSGARVRMGTGELILRLK